MIKIIYVAVALAIGAALYVYSVYDRRKGNDSWTSELVSGAVLFSVLWPVMLPLFGLYLLDDYLVNR